MDLFYPLTLERHSDKDLDQYLAELIRNICIAHETARDTLNYSNVYFGFTGAVENFGTDQIAGLQSVPMNRILLETDSQYMRPGGGGIITPAFIGDVASVVASKLRIPVQHLLNSTVQNSRQLYGC